MNSILILHEHPDTSLEEAKSFIEKKGIHPHDIFIVEPLPDKTGKKAEPTSIGIEVIKKLKTTLYLKPSQSKEKALIIPKAHMLTVPAQNALLKVLEEPPASTYLILTGITEDAFLPTILSRCSILSLTQTPQPLSEEAKQVVRKEYLQFSSLPLASLLKKAEVLAKNKTEAQEYLKTLTIVVREELLTHVDNSDKTQEHLRFLQVIAQTSRLIQLTNSNLRLALEQLFLQVKN